MPPPLNIISFIFWVSAVSYRKLKRWIQKKAGNGEETWKKKHRYTNIFGLFPPKIHLLTAEEKKESLRSKTRQNTSDELPFYIQVADKFFNYFQRDLNKGINSSFGYTVEDIDDFEEMVTKNALDQEGTVTDTVSVTP